MIKAFEKIAKEMIEWGRLNVVTYDKSKMKALFFSKSHCQWLNKQLWEAKIKIREGKISFQKEVT